MDDYQNDLMHTAIHEAGHAVIGRRLGLGCGSVTIKPDETEGIAGHSITEGPWSTVAKWEERNRYRGERTALLGRILMLMAGAEAEVICLGDCNGGDGDDRREIAYALVSIGIREDEALDRYGVRLRSWARVLVRRHRSDIEKVAGAALARGAPGSPKESNSPAPLFRTLFAARLTGQRRTTPSAAGRNRSPGTPTASPSHAGQSVASKMTGMRLCSRAISGLASVVMMVKVRSVSPSGPRQPSQRPARARGAPSVRAIA